MTIEPKPARAVREALAGGIGERLEGKPRREHLTFVYFCKQHVSGYSDYAD